MKKKLLAILCVAVLLATLGSYAVLGAESDPTQTSTETSTVPGKIITVTASDMEESENGGEEDLPAFVYSEQPQSAEEVQAAADAYLEDPKGTPLPCWEFEFEADWIPDGWQLVVRQQGDVEYYTLTQTQTDERARATRAGFIAPVYGAGVWTICSGAELHYAIANATNGDTFKLMNDLNMGAVCEYPGHDHGNAYEGVTDGIAESLYFIGTTAPGQQTYELIPGDANSSITTKNMTGMTLNFASGTGNAVTIYRRDHLPHIYANANNLTLNFENVVMDGGQTVYEPATGERALPFESTGTGTGRISTFENSSGGGMYVERAENFRLNGAVIQNCFQPHDYVKNNKNPNVLDWLGISENPANRIMQGAGIRAINAKNVLLKNCTVTHCYSDAYAGGINMFGYGGTIDGCTVTNNAIYEPLRYGAGGGISYSAISDNPVIRNSTISGNSATGEERDAGYPSRGGGVSVSGGANRTFTIENSSIRDNKSQWGGGIFVESASLTLNNVDVTGNKGAHVENAIYGGGISFYARATLTLKGNVNIKNNIGSTVDNNVLGGGLFVNGGKVVTEAGAKVILDGNKSESVNGGATGAGMYVAIGASGLDLSDWTLTNNAATSTNNSALGGGLYASLRNGSFTASGLEVKGNSAWRGGGLYFAGVTNGNTATLTGGTVSGNTAVLPEGGTPYLGCGGGISIGGNYGSLVLTNMIFTGNIAQFGPQRLDPADSLDAIHIANVTGLVSLSSPFVPGTGVAYNNHDVEYVRTPHDVNFVVNGGHTVENQTIYDGHKVTQPANFDTSKPGYVFGGWYTDGSFGAPYNFNAPVYNSLTLYAKWVDASTLYTVTFDSQSGSSVSPVTGVVGGSTIASPGAPTRGGYTFGGWFKEAACNNGWNFDSDVVNGNITLYAKWTQNSLPPPPTPVSSSNSRPISSSSASGSAAPVISEQGSDSSAVAPASANSTSSSAAEIEISSSQELTGIGGGNIPLVGQSGVYWALANLICAGVSLAGGTVALIAGIRRKKDKGEEYDEQDGENRNVGNRLWPVLAAVLGVVSPMLFFLTENVSLPMAIFDGWTPVMVAVLLAQGIFAVLQWNTKRKKDSDAGYAG